MRPYRDSRLTYIALSVFFIVVLGYTAFEARGIVLGPSITLSTNVAESTESFVVIEGYAERIASLSMNGKAVAVTEAGAFAQPYILAPGYNRIVLDATDRYGRVSSKVTEIVYRGPAIEERDEVNGSPATTQLSTTTSETPSPEAVAD